MNPERDEIGIIQYQTGSLTSESNGRLSQPKPQRGERLRSAGSGLVLGFFIISLLAGSCTPNGTATPQSVTMATDKTQYVWGDAVKLEVTNGLDVPIWYIDYPQRDLVFWEVQRAQDNGWEGVDFRLPLIEGGAGVCRIIMYEPPVGAVAELKAHSDLLYEWNQQICPLGRATETFEPEMIERGRYRFALTYSLDTMNQDVEAEPWKRPIELGETKVVYSNEFVLE